MNTDFKILNEETFNLKADKIYLMLLRDGVRFGVEVVDHEKTFGRIYAEDRIEADTLFDLITNRLSQYKYTLEAEIFLRKLFSLTKTNEMYFFLAVYGNKLSQVAIGRLIKKFGLRVTSKAGFLGNKKKAGAITINVFFESKGKSFGRFYGTRFGKDFLFESL
jgi:hypothetical protein